MHHLISSFEVDPVTGLLNQADYYPSPHCDDRPEGVVIDALIIHGISLPPGQFGGDAVRRFFQGDLPLSEHPYFETISHLRVSAHLFIERTGRVLQFVPFHRRAWHAGQSSLNGREQCNDFSIGIELEGTDQLPYESGQYHTLMSVILALRAAYPAITPQRMVGHSDIAPGRKTDPGPYFDWKMLREAL